MHSKTEKIKKVKEKIEKMREVIFELQKKRMPIKKGQLLLNPKRKPNTFITNTKNSSIQKKVIIIEEKKNK